jgi:SAM-dependent methyltransferase
MKTVVSLQDLLELEIRPDALLSEYRRLAERDVRAWSAASLHEVGCPGCGSAASHAAFERYGRAYRECDRCRSVFLSPRPDEATLAAYARSSEPATFWRERVMPATEDARREKILLPRADWVGDGVAEYAPHATTGLDLTPQGDVLIRALTDSPLRRVIAAHTAADLDVTPVPARVDVMPDALWRGAIAPVDVVTAFEVFDRAADPRALAAAVRGVLKPGGLLFLTAPSMSGFELQVLWDRAPSIAPPDKINLLTIDGFLALFSSGWDVVELSTPGMFDVESVRRAVTADPAADWPRFIRTLVDSQDERTRIEFQEYLQRARLASFARLLVRRID